MKRYAKFLRRASDGSLVDALGSDSLFPLDGRWGASRINYEARAQMWRLRIVHPDYAGFRVTNGVE